ncbi:hypothetical protein ZHAS_00005065 [Anopheles sinensis]|uniref:Uncharacterized protein n=1 Tax=Anopheles sinensis TaxID=74873 RepID=A0A084VIF7_ANOSI|nr:hypothetical protein ZHAS_00005065 [Anopheles sinensis]
MATDAPNRRDAGKTDQSALQIGAPIRTPDVVIGARTRRAGVCVAFGYVR